MTPRVVAIYRLLYGSDFIGESLASIHPYCDAVLCFVGHEMFGGRRVVRYGGRDVYLPHDVDGVGGRIESWARANDPDGRVRVVPHPCPTRLRNQVGTLVNEEVLPRFDCTHVLFVECDEVWHRDAIEALLDLAARTDDDEYMASTVLFWRSPRFASTRPDPHAVLRTVRDGRPIPPTGCALACADAVVSRRHDPRVRVHNLGFAASERTLFWKHITALGFSRDQGLDDPPREDWFERTWRDWHWRRNPRTDLCPSAGHEHAFPPAREHPADDLPEPVRRRWREQPLAEWRAQEDAP